LGTDNELVHTRLGLLAGYLSKLIIWFLIFRLWDSTNSISII
jgi:hypothetical protein